MICFENPFNTVNPVCDSNISSEKTGVHIPDTVSVNVTDLQVNLADKFRFPNKDVIDPNSYTKPFTELQCLQHIINISACKLDTDHLEFWNKVALRCDRQFCKSMFEEGIRQEPPVVTVKRNIENRDKQQEKANLNLNVPNI